MELFGTNTGCEHWNVNRQNLNKVITAYNGFCKKKHTVAHVKNKVHEFESKVAGVAESGAYLKTVDKICGFIKYDRENRRRIANQFKKGQEVYLEAGENAEPWKVTQVIDKPDTTDYKYKLENNEGVEVERFEREVKSDKFIFTW